MMDNFTAAQIAHATAITLDDFMKGDLFQNGIQEKPLLAKFESKAKTFDGTKEKISVGVKFQRGADGVDDGVTGFSHLDTVPFYNPGKGLRATYTVREHHIGFTLSETQLKQHGILVSDKMKGKLDSGSGRRAVHILHNVLNEAMIDFTEQYADTMNDLFWDDGTTDPSALHGIRTFIQDIPTLGTVGGLSAVAHDRWRNRALTAAFAADASFDAAYGGDKVTSAATNGGVLLQALQKQIRQLRRYGARPDCFFAGSDLIDAMEIEIRANGNYSETGFTKAQDGSIGEMRFKGLDVIYDPSLDDLNREKFAYIWDSRDIYLSKLEGDWRRVREPARPYNQFTVHKSILCTGQFCGRRRDGALVLEIN